MSGDKTWRQGCHVDTDKLANDLERLAEGIRNNDVGNLKIDSRTVSESDTLSKREVTLEFMFTDEYDDCLQVSFTDS